jgi:hypothetical protein
MDDPPVDVEPLELRFRFVPVRGGADDLVDAVRLPVQNRGARRVVESPEWHSSHSAVWLAQQGAVRWEGLPAVEGRYRIRMELRYTERAADARDLDEAYEIRLDGRRLDYDWAARETYNIGNAWFGHAVTEPLNLGDGPHTLAVSTTHSWCAVRGGPFLLPAE